MNSMLYIYIYIYIQEITKYSHTKSTLKENSKFVTIYAAQSTILVFYLLLSMRDKILHILKQFSL